MASDALLDGLREELGAAETITDGAFSFGIEEEYFLVDARTRQAVERTPETLFEQAFAASEGRIGRELLQTQAEADTWPCVTPGHARAELVFARSVLQAVAARHGLAVLACGTHPTASWRSAVQSGKERYDAIMGELRMIGQRSMLCGMHVHLQLPDTGRRVEVMTRLLPYLPLFLALSTSSPFWQGRETGLKSYRFAAFGELPRTGLPDPFRTEGEFQAYVDALVRAGAIKDGSHIWWAIRPSVRYPTLELRTPDCCTRVEDALAIAALYRVIARHLYFHPDGGDGLSMVAHAIAQENRWRAQRYGIQCTFVTEEGAIPVGEFLERAIALTAEDADALGCAHEVAHCRTIVAGGTSADAQPGDLPRARG
ncbi:MAG: carboxylate-amine ligase [Magnetospirillum sp.]|nr:carboxylate-amine ligase [Magnetospirillum sp.]